MDNDDRLIGRLLSRRDAALQADPRIKFIAEPRGLAPLWIAFSKRDDRSHLLWTDDYLPWTSACCDPNAPQTAMTYVASNRSTPARGRWIDIWPRSTA